LPIHPLVTPQNPGINAMLQLFIGPVKLSITTEEKIQLLPLGSKYYSTPIFPTEKHYKLHIRTIPPNSLPPVASNNQLTGKTEDQLLMPYSWQITNAAELLYYDIDYLKDKQLLHSRTCINLLRNTIDLLLIPSSPEKKITLDPLEHPFGSLLLVFLAQQTNGILIHASAIQAPQQGGMLFTAISGTGKSTMADLWEKNGAQIINDDRLWLHKHNKNWVILNTPMPLYSQAPAMAPLKKIFLIRQSQTNNVARLTDLNSNLKVLSNCIQHPYNKSIAAQNLNTVLDITNSTPIYDCGFKPDHEIVDLIMKH
jgi:hypothetical protein